MTKQATKKTVTRTEVQDATEVVKESKSIVPLSHKQAYGKAGNCGDDLAKLLSNYKEQGGALEPLAKANGVDLSRWSHLNPGMQRMNLGNVLRGMAKNGVEISVPSIPKAKKAA